MLLFKNLSNEKKKEIVDYIKMNRNEDATIIAKKFNISIKKVELLKKKYLEKRSPTPGF